jgi:glutaminase
MASPKDFISPVNSGQKLVYPFRNYLNYLHDKYSDLQTGKIADYIPELGLAE